jgi:FkbM family methyltransferase
MLRSVPLTSRLLSPKSISGISKYIIMRSALEANEIEIILDVGANIGQFAQSMRQIGYKGRIISFEPVGVLFERLKAASRNDRLWTVMNFALGLQPEIKTLHVMANSEFSSFQEPDQTFRKESQNTVMMTEDVEIRRLDAVIEELGIADHLHHCLLKSDTQGFDLNVLQGCGQRLSQLRMIDVEVSSVAMYKNVSKMGEMLAFLDNDFLMINLFPIVRMRSGAAYEFDYLGVNRKWSLGSEEGAPE